jgi:hypothetical protein
VRRAAEQEMTAARTARNPRDFDQARDHVRTFSFGRASWNRVLSARHYLWHAGGKGTSYAGSGRALTAMEADPGAPYLTGASCRPLHQALRIQHIAFAVMFEKRAWYPPFKSQRSKQSAHCTCCAFDLRGSKLRLAETGARLREVWAANSSCFSRSSPSSWRGKPDGTTDARPADPAYIRSDPRYARECQLSPSPGNRPGQDPARRRQGGTGG